MWSLFQFWGNKSQNGWQFVLFFCQHHLDIHVSTNVLAKCSIYGLWSSQQLSVLKVNTFKAYIIPVHVLLHSVRLAGSTRITTVGSTTDFHSFGTTRSAKVTSHRAEKITLNIWRTCKEFKIIGGGWICTILHFQGIEKSRYTHVNELTLCIWGLGGPGIKAYVSKRIQ